MAWTSIRGGGGTSRAWSAAVAALACASLALTLCLAVYRLGPSMPDYPAGCDAFGHLRMAQYIETGNLLRHDYNRPFHQRLMERLDAAGYQTPQYAWMLAPHAHHVEPHVKRVIDQYQPGSGLLLSLVGPRERIFFYPLLALSFAALALLVAGALARWPARDTLLGAAVTVCALYFWWTSGRLPNSQSVALSLGLLTGVGILLEKNPRAAFAFLGLSLLLRLSNLLYAPVLFAYAFFHARQAGLDRRGTALFLLQCGFVFFAAGLGEVLLYQHLLTGSALRVTYSVLDTEAVASLDALLGNVRFYLVTHYPYALANALLFAAVCLLARDRRPRWVMPATAGLLLAANYGYYLLHQVHVPHYPYPTVFIFWGLALGMFLERHGARPPAAAALLGVCCAASLLSLWLAAPPDVKGRLDRAAQARAALCAQFSPCAVVWAEKYSGTVEYVSPANGFRYKWGPKELRAEVVRWLYGQGYSQAFCLDDIGAQEDVRGFVAWALPDARPELRPGPLGPLLVVAPAEAARPRAEN